MTFAIPTIAVFPEEKLTLDQKIEKWVWQYCRSLEENYKQHSIRMSSNYTSDYSKQQLESIKNGTANLTKFRMDQVVSIGKLYNKITTHFVIEMNIEMEEFILSLIKKQVKFINLLHGNHLIQSM